MDINVIFKKFMKDPKVAQAFYSELKAAGVQLETFNIKPSISQEMKISSAPSQNSTSKNKSVHKPQARLVRESVHSLGSSNSVFNLKKIGMRHYDEWLNSQSARDRDNVKIEIEELSPKEYLDACAKIFGNSFESQKRQVQYDKEIIQELQDLIEKGVSLNATFLDYVSNPPTQEGRHRMYALAELYGWDKKYPVIIFTPADPERAKRDQLEKQQEKLYKYIDKAVTNALDYTYRNYDELKDQISYYLENYIDDPEVKILDRGHWLAIVVNGLEYEISQDEFDWDEDKSDLDDDFDIEDLN